MPDVPPPASVPQPAFVDVNLQQQGHVDSAQMSASSVGEHILGMPSMPVQQGTLGMPADDIDTAAGIEQHPRGRLFLRRAHCCVRALRARRARHTAARPCDSMRVWWRLLAGPSDLCA